MVGESDWERWRGWVASMGVDSEHVAAATAVAMELRRCGAPDGVVAAAAGLAGRVVTSDAPLRDELERMDVLLAEVRRVRRRWRCCATASSRAAAPSGRPGATGTDRAGADRAGSAAPASCEPRRRQV